MTSIERTIEVRWRHRALFTERVFAPENPVLREVLCDGPSAPVGRKARALLLLDESLAKSRAGLVDEVEAYFAAHADTLELVCPPVVMLGGETVKNAYFRVSEVHALIERRHIDRHNYLVVAGGGALLDMAGLAAATAHRGVRLVRLPSTTLAQADSGVGVKNGINAFGKKNFVGTFAPPFAVINDFSLLDTLPARDKRSGYSEAVKVACIRDASFFGELERDADALAEFDPAALRRLIFRTAELHLNHIASGGDPFETGSARPLDFGHWSAHKLEQISEYRLRHGEAVASGIALDVLYSRRMGYLGSAEAERVLLLLERLGFDLFAPEYLHHDEAGELLVVAGLEEFREHLGGVLTITLLEGLGRGFEVHEMSLPAVRQSIFELRDRAAASARPDCGTVAQSR